MRIKGKTKICVLLGYPLGHTLSPLMQNAAFSYRRLDYLYVPWEVRPESLERAVAALQVWENFRGANVTIPHKERILGLVDRLSPEAQAIGAVNCLSLREGCLFGDNTDGKGFLLSLQEAGVEVEGKRILLFGAGGAARAVAFALAWSGARRISLVNRTREKAEVLASHLRDFAPSCHVGAHSLDSAELTDLVRESEIVVNCTSVGLSPKDPPLFDYSFFEASSLVCDLIYNPQETRFLEAARRAGCRTIGGLGMLLHQGALSFELWTGEKAPLKTMRRALEGALGFRT